MFAIFDAHCRTTIWTHPDKTRIHTNMSKQGGSNQNLRSLLLYTELELKETHERKWVISLLKVAVQLAKDYVFSGVLEGGEQEDQDLFGKITDLIKD